ncbi:MAG TPA: TetR/AcrR family transcriptional regulator [Desulfitobacteriaceae bacterium]|nr:TetR/AcrR family transcriptional regulator [Desulfitobacteriaceae bacterium]
MEENKLLFDFPRQRDNRVFRELTDKQWKILNAALEVFTEKGYSAATTSEIARKAGVAEGTIFRHFKTKKDILLATMIPIMQNMLGPGASTSLQELLERNGNLPMEEILLIILEDRQKFFEKYSPLLRVIYVEANFHPELREVLVNEVIIKSQENLLRFLEKRQKAGDLRSDLDVWVMTRSLVGAVLVYYFSKVIFPQREKGKDDRTEFKTIINLFLQGAQTTTAGND